MKKQILALVLGLILGSSATALGQQSLWGYYTVGEMREKTSLFRLAYAAGASDMLGAVVMYFVTSEDSYETDARTLSAFSKCLRFRGENLGALTSTAEAKWTNTDESVQAAHALLVQACK